MKNMFKNTMTATAAGLMLCAGMAMSAAAQQNNDASRPGMNEPKRPMDSGAYRGENKSDAMARVTTTRVSVLEFHKSSDLMGIDVVNPNGETVGEIEDFLVDRGSGRIEHAILKSGEILGMGGKAVAVPYARLGYNVADKKFTANMTKEQIDRSARFIPENWTDQKQTTWAEDLDRWWSGESAGDDRRATGLDRVGPYEQAIKDGERKDIRGTIERVDRQYGANGEEQAVVTVRRDDGQMCKVVLGPSWYVMGQNAAPMRGQQITAKAVKLDGKFDDRREYRDYDDADRRDMNDQNRDANRDPNKADTHMAKDRYVAVTATVGNERLNLRNEQGSAYWRLTRQNATNTDNQRNGEPAAYQGGRLVLLSDVVGADARLGTESTGEIEDAVIERHSGHVALLALDPNTATLGVGDTLRAVPWQAARMNADGTVRIDANPQSLPKWDQLPEDVAVYNTRSRLVPAYEAFQMNVYTFEPVSQRNQDRADGSWNNNRDRTSPGAERGDIADKNWNKDGKWTKAFKDGKDVTLTGTIKDTRAGDPMSTGQPVKMLVISTDSGEKQVVLGPTWYIDKQNLSLDNGDKVTVTGKMGTCDDGKQYVCAYNLTVDGQQVTMWENGSPRWAPDR